MIGVVLFLVALLVALFVGSAILRAGVSIANRVIGRVKTEKPIGWDWDEDEEDEDDFDDYGRERENPLPEPGIAQGMLVVMLAAVAQLLFGFGLAFIMEPDRRRRDWDDTGPNIVAHILGVVVGFLTVTGLLAAMLPTTGKRAALATLFSYLIVLAIVVLVAALLLILRVARI